MDNMNDQSNQNSKEEAAERFRRLKASGEEYDADAATPPRRKPVEISNTESSNVEPSLSAAQESENKPMEDKADQKSGPESPDHHPTGDPQNTAGWFAEDLDKAENAVKENHEPDPPATEGKKTENPATQQPNVEHGWQDRYQQGTSPFIPPIPGKQAEDLEATRAHPVNPLNQQDSLPPPPGATQPFIPHPVNQYDTQATRVTPAAYGNYPQQQPTRPHQVPMMQTEPVKTKRGRRNQPAEPTEEEGGFSQAWGCFIRVVLVSLFLVVLGVIVTGSILVFQYFKIVQTLPPVGELKERVSTFETTRILDRNGNSIYEILDPNQGRRTYVPLQEISPYLIAATLATEDKEYYNHPGFDPIAVARAFWQNYTAGEIVSGASTITQQLARMLLLDDTERYSRTYERKAREIVLAAEITRHYSKEEILEIFLNENNYGNLAYGVEAAAETYFNITADRLSLSQASFLAGLPQAPAVYDIYTNRDVTLNRQKQVLILMYELSKEKNCIYTSTYSEDLCINEIASAAQETENYDFQRRDYSMRYPHWVNYIRTQLESQFDPQTIYRSGFTVYTTLDPGLQESAEAIIKNQIALLQDKNASSGALVVIRPSNGEILAMVGSADFYNEAISGQVNMALAPRQPGSSIKPLVYLAAFEKGWNPATLIWDVPSEFPPSGDPNDLRDPYKPVNYDGRFHGPQTVRSSLANSFNVPAVKALDFVGIYDNPGTPEKDGFIQFAQRMGLTSLTRDDYGMSLALGGGDVTVLEMTQAFATIANGGREIPPVAITKIVDHLGNVVYEYRQPAGEQIIRAEHAYLINSILSDNQARSPMFGANSILNLPFQVAVKTGTTNDFRDNWTIGFTPDVSIGVWVGNADYTPMVDTSGLTGAAPIWAEVMQMAINNLTGNNPSTLVRPAGIVDRVICSTSGTEPSQWCSNQRNEIFAYDQLPLTKENDLWIKTKIDTWTGYLASAACSEFNDEVFVLNVKEKWAVKWIKDDSQGRSWAESIGFGSPVTFLPERECKADDPRARIIFSNLSDGQTVTSNPLDIYGVVDAAQNYDKMRVEYGKGNDPSEWKELKEDSSRFPDVERLVTWDLLEEEIEPGEYTIRIRIESTEEGRFAEKRVHILIQVATPTPTATPTFTVTPTVTATLLPTHTPTVTITLTPEPPTPIPTSTPTEVVAPTVPVPDPSPTPETTNPEPITSSTLTSTIPTFTTTATLESTLATPTVTPTQETSTPIPTESATP